MTYPPSGQPPYGPSFYPAPPYGYAPQANYRYPPLPGGSRQPPRTQRTGLILAVIAVLLLATGAVVAAALVLTDPRTEAPPSDAQRIEAAIRDFYDTLGANGFRAAATKTCATDRTEFDALPEPEKQRFDRTDVEVTIDKIENIMITGDTATAHVTGRLTLTLPGEQPDTDNNTDEHLKKENGVWKICSSRSGPN